jgi:hypothetical protein
MAEKLSVVVSWGLTWFKNASDEGGAMKYVISKCKEGEVVIHSQSKKHGRMWTSCIPDKACDLINKNHGIYEVITTYPHKLYFDIDNKTPETPIFETAMAHIKSLWAEGNWAISGSKTEEKESYHIVSDTYVIHNEAERDMVKCAVKYLQTKLDSFDWKVYTNNRNMKCINQSKDDGRVQEIIENPDFKAHLICSFIPNYCKPIDCNFQDDLKEQIQIENARKRFDLSTLPRLSLQPPSNFNYDDLTPKEILDLLPYKASPKSFEFTYLSRISRFCYYNGLSHDDFCNWAGWRVNADGIKMWNSLHKFPPLSIDAAKAILFYFYPSLKKDIFMHKFTNQFRVPDYVVVTQIDRLSQEHYTEAFKFTALNLTMGSGKTAQTIDYLKSSYGGFCWIAHNQALVAGTITRMREAHVDCTHYASIDAKSKKAGALRNINNLCICSASLFHIPLDKQYNVLVIDEIESLVDAFCGELMKDNKQLCFSVFKHLIKTSNKVIVIDAFITMKTYNLLRLIDPDAKINMIIQANVSPSKTLIFKTAPKDSEDDDLMSQSLSEICSYMRKGENVFIFYPYKTGKTGTNYNRLSMDDVKNRIVAKTGIRVSDIIIYNSDVDDKIKDGLKNVNKTWAGKRCIIVNSCVTAGVNFDIPGFNRVFMFIASFITPRQSIQVSARIRQLETNEIVVYYLGRQQNQNTFKDDTKKMNCPIYHRLFHDYLIEEKAPRRKAFEYFCMKAPYKMKVNKMIVDTQISSELSQFQNSEFEFAYDKIENIESAYANTIEQMVMHQEATMFDKFQLKKFYFKLKFANLPETEEKEETIKNAWDYNMFGIVS